MNIDGSTSELVFTVLSNTVFGTIGRLCDILFGLINAFLRITPIDIATNIAIDRPFYGLYIIRASSEKSPILT